MLIAIDIGNTNIVAGLFDNDILKHQIRFVTDKDITQQQISDLFAPFLNNSKAIDSIIISSVVPFMNDIIDKSINNITGCVPVFVNVTMPSNIRVDMPNPLELGTDRFVNCVGAFALYNAPLIIIDYGTANKYDVVDRNGVFVTGITTPGINLRISSLASGTALLSHVPINIPDSISAVDTISSIQVGVFYGILAETEYFIKQITNEYDDEFTVVLTGGLSGVFADRLTTNTIINPTLTLEGLNICAKAWS